MTETPTGSSVVYGRRPLLLLWAVAVGLLFRGTSPYRYAQADSTYPWPEVAIVLIVLSLEAAGLYLLLRYAPRRTIASNVWRAAAICLVLTLVHGSLVDFNSHPWDWVVFDFAVAGTLVFGGYAVALSIGHHVTTSRRRHDDSAILPTEGP